MTLRGETTAESDALAQADALIEDDVRARVEHDPIRVGVRLLFRLGLDISGLIQLGNVSAATIKRYVASVYQVRKMPPMTLKKELALASYWVHKIDRGRGQPAVSPQSPFLDRFCPVCVGAPPRQPDRRTHPEDEEPWVSQVRFDSGHHAFYVSANMCGAGTKICVSGALRFALLAWLCMVDPWRAYLALLDVNPRRRWVRTCYKCGKSIITDSPAHRLCVTCR